MANGSGYYGMSGAQYSAPENYGRKPKKSEFYSYAPPPGAAQGMTAWGAPPQTPTFDQSGYDQAVSGWKDDRSQAMAAAGRNPDGSPIAPELNSLLDPETGQLKEGWEFDPSSIAGYGQLEEFATGTGPSAYAEAAQDRLGLQTAIERDRIAQEGNTAAATARSNLAMRGGLSSGARERVGDAAGAGTLKARQSARQAQLMGGADISMQDAAARQGALQNFVGMGADVGQFNMGTRMSELQNERNFAMDKYKEEGSKWGAKKKAASERKIAEQGK